MANIKSAKKKAVQSEKRRKINLARKTALKTVMKKVVTALDQAEPIEDIVGLLREAEAKLARAKSKGVMHKGTASRKVSRLAKRIAAAKKSQS